MKKLLLLLLVFTGMVSTASAVKLNLHLQSNSFFVPNDNARLMAHIYNGGTEADVEMTKEFKYGNIWYSCELNGNTKVIVVRQNPSYGTSTSINWDNGNYSSDIVWARTDEVSDLSTTEDIYSELWYSSSDKKLGIYNDNIQPAWSGLIIRDSKVGWDGNSANMETTDNNTFTKTYTKAEIESVASAGTQFLFHFKHVNNVYFDESGTNRSGQWKEIHASSDTEMSLGSSTDVTTQNNENSGNSWYVTVPDYNYEKMVFTADYVKDGSSYKWVISADAYISKTISSEGIATFGSAANVDLSKAVPALTSAKKGKVESNGKITWADVTTLAANKGALIEGAEGTYSIPVATSGDDTDNDFVAIVEKGVVNQTMNEKNAYILSKVNNVLGFYKPADEGSWCAAGTAYLNTSVAPAAARGFFPIWGEETTGVDAVKNTKITENTAYNLAGQRVANPTKGLYIVNGKKVIIK